MLGKKKDEEKIQELIIMKSVKKTKKLEIITIVLSIFMTVFYNLLPLIVTIPMENADVVNNEEFYENDDVMRAWMAYLISTLAV